MSIVINPGTSGIPVPAALQVLPSIPYSVLNGNGGVLLKTGAGVLYGFSVVIIGVVSTITLYDGIDTSGQKLVSSLSTTVLGPLNLGIPDGFGMQFQTGLYASLAGTTAPTALIFWN